MPDCSGLTSLTLDQLASAQLMKDAKPTRVRHTNESLASQLDLSRSVAALVVAYTSEGSIHIVSHSRFCSVKGPLIGAIVKPNTSFQRR